MNITTEAKQEYASVEEAWVALQTVPSYVERGTDMQEQENDALTVKWLQAIVAL